MLETIKQKFRNAFDQLFLSLEGNSQHASTVTKKTSTGVGIPQITNVFINTQSYSYHHKELPHLRYRYIRISTLGDGYLHVKSSYDHGALNNGFEINYKRNVTGRSNSFFRVPQELPIEIFIRNSRGRVNLKKQSIEVLHDNSLIHYFYKKSNKKPWKFKDGLLIIHKESVVPQRDVGIQPKEELSEMFHEHPAYPEYSFEDEYREHQDVWIFEKQLQNNIFKQMPKLEITKNISIFSDEEKL